MCVCRLIATYNLSVELSKLQYVILNSVIGVHYDRVSFYVIFYIRPKCLCLRIMLM
jgi:hypothetical protein